MSNTIRLTPYTAGEDAYQALPAILKAWGQKPALIAGHRAMAAALPRLQDALSAAGLELAAALPFKGHTTMEAAEALAGMAQLREADVILGMGGGRALDTAKAVGHLLNLPVFTLPTIAATCAAVSALSVMYNPDGSLDRFLFLNSAPVHCFIDTQVIAASPAKYLRAGIGDSLAKHVEVPFSARGQTLRHQDQLGLSIAEGLWPALMATAQGALQEAARQEPGPDLTAAALCSIVNVGYVSALVDERFNGALAHSLYYAMDSLPQMGSLLHGDVVAWGALVQLTLDGQLERASELRGLLNAIGIAPRLGDMGIHAADPALLACLEGALKQPDMRTVPYPITAQDIVSAVKRCEEDTACSPT